MATSIQITFDSGDPSKLATFWAAALGYVLQPPPEGYGDWETFLAEHGMADRIGTASAIVDPQGAGPRLYFQQVPEPKTAKNRVHLDLNVSDIRRVGPVEGRRRIEAEAQRLVSLGATVLGANDEAGEAWTVMADPDGNEFCLH